MIPQTHPRYESLRIREMLVGGFEAGAVAAEGLLAHGRGEAFDYMLGEESTAQSKRAARAAAAALLLSANPVISVNGNLAALCCKDVVRLAAAAEARLEINLFYDSAGRRRVIAGMLRRCGAPDVLGAERGGSVLHGIDSARRMVDKEGILAADTVLVPLEDGDRAEALAAAGKRVIAIDLNPASRTARVAHITMVDNVVRAVPMLAEYCGRMSGYGRAALQEEVESFQNDANLAACAARMSRNFGGVPHA